MGVCVTAVLFAAHVKLLDKHYWHALASLDPHLVCGESVDKVGLIAN